MANKRVASRNHLLMRKKITTAHAKEELPEIGQRGVEDHWAIPTFKCNLCLLIFGKTKCD